MATFRRAADAVPYEAPHHFGVSSRRLQGLEASETSAYWVAVSDYQPGGGVSESPARGETTYVGLSGALTVRVDGTDHRLTAGDSLHLVAGELRTVVNDGPDAASILVVIAPA
jgi:quercetin dioxygenase-like cupin family protein